MSKYSPTVLPQPDGAGAAIAQGLANGFQNFLAIRNAREGRLRQQQQDTAAAKQREFENALRERQMALQEQAAQRQREQQQRENAQAGYTPATDTTVDLGPLGQALAGQAGMGVTGAVLEQTPPTTLHTPASYDFTKSQSYQSAQAAATRAAQAADQQAQRERETHRINRDYDIRNPLPVRPTASTPTDRSNAAAIRWIANRTAQLAKGGRNPTTGIVEPGLSPEAAARQAKQEYAASVGMVTPPAGGYVVPAERTSGRPVIRGGDNPTVGPAPGAPAPPAVQPETQPESPNAARMRAVTKQAQGAIAMIDGSKGKITPQQAMRSSNLTPEAKMIIARHYGVAVSDTMTVRAGGGR